MIREKNVSPYHGSITKKFLDYTSAASGLILSLPLFIIISLAIKAEDRGEVLFKQERIGKNGKRFLLYKFRTMVPGAEKQKNKYESLNIADGPVFKIPNDPRYTKFGRVLVKTGLDELPQLYNVIKGQMSLVGPRPLPYYEEKYLTKPQKIRESVLPGITSPWVIKGAHRLKFSEWMNLDREYVLEGTFSEDLRTIFGTLFLLIRLTLKKLNPLNIYKTPRR